MVVQRKAERDGGRLEEWREVGGVEKDLDV